MAYDPLAGLRAIKPAWKQALDDLPTTRACAGCDACCTVMQIEELDKPAGVRCRHLSGGGCGIWGAHPQPCKTYVCLWRLSDDILPADLFPAKSGFVLSVHSMTVWPAMVTLSLIPGAASGGWRAPDVLAGLKALAAAWNCPVSVMEGEVGTHAISPAGNLYARAERPEMFLHEGRALNLPEAEYGPDRRVPYLRMQEQQFRWPSADATSASAGAS